MVIYLRFLIYLKNGWYPYCMIWLSERVVASESLKMRICFEYNSHNLKSLVFLARHVVTIWFISDYYWQLLLLSLLLLSLSFSTTITVLFIAVEEVIQFFGSNIKHFEYLKSGTLNVVRRELFYYQWPGFHRTLLLVILRG